MLLRRDQSGSASNSGAPLSKSRIRWNTYAGVAPAGFVEVEHFGHGHRRDIFLHIGECATVAE